MDQITHEVRLARWKEVIGQCQSRPEGQSIRDWCKQNDVSEKRYYYWQRRIRLQIAEGMSGSLIPAAGNEPGAFQLFTGERRWKFYAAVWITVEGLEDREPCLFDQTIPFVFFPAVNFLLQGSS